MPTAALTRGLALAVAVLAATDLSRAAQGLSTWHTARNFAARFAGGRVLAVSHGYHLPRVKLAFERAGVEAYTVPARETRRLRGLPWYVTREIAAFWVYYLAPAG